LTQPFCAGFFFNKLHSAIPLASVSLNALAPARADVRTEKPESRALLNASSLGEGLTAKVSSRPVMLVRARDNQARRVIGPQCGKFGKDVCDNWEKKI